MIKMIIQMDDKKINNEKKYHLEKIYGVINGSFEKLGLNRADSDEDALVYQGTGKPTDYGRFGKIVNTLKKQDWFMDNVMLWNLCSNDESDDPKDFDVEDLLAHYKKKMVRM